MFKVKNPEQLSTSKFLDEVAELRNKQLQGVAHQSQKEQSSQKQNQMPSFEEMPEHRYSVNKNKPPANYQPPMTQPYLPEHISPDIIEHRYLKSSEESNIHRQYPSIIGGHRPPLNPRGHSIGNEADRSSQRRQQVDHVTDYSVAK